ncbi:transcriptional regulator, LysR family [Moritella sp. PE36]|uniref:LysR family transcriptional regulator n=2 Tax=unclassified Moritella TaxID=2637987 RepID=UPI0001568349|nr:LysR family transcriptional regulator [Moritella sp. PE36]EDM68258.1 transcriptional regulator, LysR family [Moritella sp. PE36]
MKSIDLNSLAWFCKIVEQGSIQAAAQLLLVPAPTLSRHLKQLEQRLGVKLLNRSAHVMELTQEGQRYYQGLHASINAIDEALLQLENDNVSLTGMIRLSAPNSVINSYLNLWLIEFMQTYPGVKCELNTALDDNQAILEGVDLALTVYPSKQADWVQKRLFSRTFCVVASPEYLILARALDNPTMLSEHHLLGSNSDHQWVFINGDDSTVVSPSFRYINNDVHNILAACLQGLGICCVPEFFIRQHIGKGRLVQLLTDYQLPERGLYMTYPDRVLLPLRVRRLIDFLTEKFTVMLEDKRVG